MDTNKFIIKLQSFLKHATLKNISVITSRVLYPNWWTSSYFTKDWEYFFSEEQYNLTAMISSVLLLQVLLAGFSLFSLFWIVLLSVFYRRLVAGGFCFNGISLEGQTVVITGANSGIGKETAREIIKRGARVILACRDVARGTQAKEEMTRNCGGHRVEVRKCDLASLASVRNFADGIKKDNIKVHILINNAGVMMCPYTETKEGFEMQMGTNHLGHFLLTNLLLPQMKHGEPARIINVSSILHLPGVIDFTNFNYEKGYDKFMGYCNSKLANVLFTRQLAKELSGTNIQVFAPYPGPVYTKLMRHVFSEWFYDYIVTLFIKTTSQGRHTSVYCATEAKQHPDMYFSDCAVGWVIPEGKDDRLAKELWDHSAKLTKLNR